MSPSARLRDGVSVSVWPRGLLLSHPEQDEIWLPPTEATRLWQHTVQPAPTWPAELSVRLAPLLVDQPPNDPDALRLAQLQTLDRRYGATWPKDDPESVARVAQAELLVARRQWFFAPRLARPTLPASMAQRATWVLGQHPDRVYIDDDIDGLSILLAAQMEVVTFAPDPLRAAWLRAAADRAGVRDQLLLLNQIPGDAVCDLALLTAGPPYATGQAAQRARAALKPGHPVAIWVRLPWDGLFWDWVETADLAVVGQQRDVDHWLLPEQRVVDGGGDLVWLEQLPEALPSTSDPASAEQVRAQPYLTLDVSSLAPDQMNDTAIIRLVDAVARRARGPETFRWTTANDERQVAHWYDKRGWGITAELWPEREHLMITLLPYDPTLEYAVLSAVFATLGDSYSRCRPLRTRRWQEEHIFG